MSQYLKSYKEAFAFQHTGITKQLMTLFENRIFVIKSFGFSLENNSLYKWTEQN